MICSWIRLTVSRKTHFTDKDDDGDNDDAHAIP